MEKHQAEYSGHKKDCGRSVPYTCRLNNQIVDMNTEVKRHLGAFRIAVSEATEANTERSLPQQMLGNTQQQLWRDIWLGCLLYKLSGERRKERRHTQINN